ncbi:divalent cation tolerance protein CutA [Candidatus Sodalis endolongispinus]|uniref:Divalent-cation tolerance protein CutA n=1 Tax=Candidatus Sodalis endolongispinus TaxID=2812662 RepID=A0ABS5YA29_9GAMM|nr:divalent cation tolerance protein CutA [Candidatus Sodalis endolongispinus]
MADNPEGKPGGDHLQPEKPGWCLILCTAPDDACACVIARRLLAGKLAACVTLLPGATSFYHWQGALEQQAEVQLLIKSHATLQQTVFAQIKAHHPYQTPELLVLPVTGGDPDYLSWLNDALR